MLGDTVNIKPEHIDKAEMLLPTIHQYYSNPEYTLQTKLVVLVGGESGVGKTEVNTVLQKMLWERFSLRAKQIHLDDYYETNWQTRDSIRQKRGITSVGLCEIEWSKLQKIIKIFHSSKGKLYVQRIHRYLNDIEYTIAPNRKIDILLIEGLYANYLRKICPVQTGLGIYLEGGIKDTYSFRKERAKENPDDTFRLEVLKKESIDVRSTRQYADIVVPFHLNKK